MNLTAVYEWATNDTQNALLKKQLAAAIANAAVLVLSESKDAENYAARRAWASSVLATPESPLEWANKMIWGVLGNVAIQGELAAQGSVVPDNDLAFVVASLIDVYAP